MRYLNPDYVIFYKRKNKNKKGRSNYIFSLPSLPKWRVGEYSSRAEYIEQTVDHPSIIFPHANLGRAIGNIKPIEVSGLFIPYNMIPENPYCWEVSRRGSAIGVREFKEGNSFLINRYNHKENIETPTFYMVSPECEDLEAVLNRLNAPEDLLIESPRELPSSIWER